MLASAYSTLSTIFLDGGRYSGAKENAKYSLEIGSNQIISNYLLVLIDLKEKKYNLAIDRLKKMLIMLNNSDLFRSDNAMDKAFTKLSLEGLI